MNKNAKIRFISWFAAVSLIAGGCTLIKNDYEKNKIITAVSTEESDKKSKCELNITSNVTEKVNVKLIDANGRIVDSWIQNDTTHYINNLNQGLYTIECQSDSFSFVEENVAINPDMCAEIYICNGYLMVGYYNSQDNTVSYNSNLLLAKRK